MPIITRFAPSPTGSLHIGGARTALFNYIFAKSNNGIFKIRIEDTDKSRNIQASIESIINGLNWLGLNTDQKVNFQSKNKNSHISIIKKMVDSGLAYKCFHTEEELIVKRKQNKKFKSEWRDKKENSSKNGNFCIRIKSPINGKSKIIDKIQGEVQVENNELDDFIILRKDGSPTFLLSSAVDDNEMLITDIIRGDDHLTNSFRQLEIFKFLNYKPNFSHMSLIHNEKNEKLSKRDNVLSIDDYKRKGFLKESLINYMLRMGWSYGNNEIISIDEAIKNFTLEKVSKSPAMIDEKKLIFLNNYYINNTPEENILEIFNQLDISEFKKINIDISVKLKLISLFKKRSSSTLEIKDKIIQIYKNKYTHMENEKIILDSLKKNKSFIIDEFSSIVEWNEYIIEEKLKYILEKLDLKFKQLGQPLRLLLSGSLNGPSISKLMEIIGKDLSLEKLNHNW
ncbi:MAG: glutamate--tRNA ligase [Alphaproteobacteria bacterium]|nr:glutamate--tRNA ligase [Alphaproteobacteria bacterium]